MMDSRRIRREGASVNLYESLRCYTASDMYPMHMPGHKRNPAIQMENPYGWDVTEVEGTDDLHHPTGMIRELLDQMKQIYGTEESRLLVNGSTSGVLTAISSCVRRGDTIIMGRNCHRSVYHAVYLLELNPVYLYPETDRETGIALGLRKEQAEEALRHHPEAVCVVVTSPTYEGVVSDVRGIADCTHAKGLPLIVDEAHGAHFIWGHRVWQDIPESAVRQGADLVVQSLHKTLPALTQTAVLHRCSDRVDPERIRRYLDIYETSSPSYVLMASVAQCMDWMEKNSGKEFLLFQEYTKKFCQQAEEWKCLSLWEHWEKEPSKLVIRSGPLTGCELSGILREKYHIQLEMEAADYVLAMTSLCDTEKGWQRLAAALAEIDQTLQQRDEALQETKRIVPPFAAGGSGKRRKSLYKALNDPCRSVRLEDSIGETSAEYAFVYPPGVPFLVPGEEITAEVLEQIWQAKERHLNLMGLQDETGRYIRICEDSV